MGVWDLGFGVWDWGPELRGGCSGFGIWGLGSGIGTRSRGAQWRVEGQVRAYLLAAHEVLLRPHYHLLALGEVTEDHSRRACVEPLEDIAQVGELDAEADKLHLDVQLCLFVHDLACEHLSDHEGGSELQEAEWLVYRGEGWPR